MDKLEDHIISYEEFCYSKAPVILLEIGDKRIFNPQYNGLKINTKIITSISFGINITFQQNDKNLSKIDKIYKEFYLSPGYSKFFYLKKEIILNRRNNCIIRFSLIINLHVFKKEYNKEYEQFIINGFELFLFSIFKKEDIIYYNGINKSINYTYGI